MLRDRNVRFLQHYLCIYKLQFRGALNQTFNCVNTKLLRQICTRHIITPLSRVQNDNLLVGVYYINSKNLYAIGSRPHDGKRVPSFMEKNEVLKTEAFWIINVDGRKCF